MDTWNTVKYSPGRWSLMIPLEKFQERPAVSRWYEMLAYRHPFPTWTLSVPFEPICIAGMTLFRTEEDHTRIYPMVLTHAKCLQGPQTGPVRAGVPQGFHLQGSRRIWKGTIICPVQREVRVNIKVILPMFPARHHTIGPLVTTLEGLPSQHLLLRVATRHK
jgi:hypothetical protein